MGLCASGPSEKDLAVIAKIQSYISTNTIESSRIPSTIILKMPLETLLKSLIMAIRSKDLLSAKEAIKVWANETALGFYDLMMSDEVMWIYGRTILMLALGTINENSASVSSAVVLFRGYENWDAMGVIIKQSPFNQTEINECIQLYDELFIDLYRRSNWSQFMISMGSNTFRRRNLPK